MKGKLILSDGTVFHGQLLAAGATVGEVVFNTGMTGYQEVLTDPSYCGQIVTMTYPLIGNYGVAEAFAQSRQPFVKGFIIGELCQTPSNWEMEGSFGSYLQRFNIPCLYGVDTRAITKKIRNHGTMKGIIVSEEAAQSDIDALLASELGCCQVMDVTTKETYHMSNSGGPKVAVLDFGIKQNILNSLHQRGCDITVYPATVSAEEVLASNPDGVFLSNGPGDPKDLQEIIQMVRQLLGKKPLFGICLGHQILALALGADTYKLKFGHRGSNQPVKNLLTGKVHITSQNHGYSVKEESLKGLDVTISHRAVNDDTVEGIRHNTLPLFSVQYHPEAAPGPDDNTYLFEEFMQLMGRA